MKHKLINFEGIVNKLIVNNLLINYIKKAAAHRCSVAVFKKSEAVVSKCSSKWLFIEIS